MRVNRLKWLSFIIPIILSLALVDVASSPGAILYIDPVVDHTLQAPSTFNVTLDVADVSNLFSWQANVSYDPAVLQVTDWYFGDFLKGNPNETRECTPFDDLTAPAFEETRNPTASTPGAVSGWVLPFRAFGNEPSGTSQYATCNTPDAEEIYYGYGFSTGSLTEITRLEVGVDSKIPEANISERDRLEIEVSNDGGTTWGAIHEVPSSQTDLLVWVDVTEDFSWTPAMLTNFRAKVRYKQVGASVTTAYLDWMGGRVGDTLYVDNPVRARDTNLDSYASFLYSQRDASFVVGNSTRDPYASSTILQVDLNVRYEATASASGDQYRILYYGTSYYNPTTKYTLVGWTSSASALATHTWTNPTNPFGGGWTWADIEDIQFEVQTDKDGGDGTATFHLYEAWITVTYTRPIYSTYYLDNPTGFLFLMESTQGEYPLGIDGSGTLATITFEVQSYGVTGINIDDPLTTLQNPQYLDISFTPQNGYFRNYYPGDIDGDWDCDYDDFNFFAAAYLKTSAHGLYNPEADFDYDGDVDYDDFNIFAINYLKTFP